MSAYAQCLLYWANNARSPCADDADRAYCEACARVWAAAIIAGDECAPMAEAMLNTLGDQP